MRSALKDYMEKLPEPFVMLEIETRIKEKTPFVVVALQEVSEQRIGCAGPAQLLQVKILLEHAL